jgi:hypothetical protein
MTDRPIIFSGAMVRALLEGRKTMMRRVFKLPTKDIYEHPQMGGWEATTSGGPGCFTIARDGTKKPAPEQIGIWHRTCGVCIDAPYQVGDRLYVREKWRQAYPKTSYSEGIVYHADKVKALGMDEYSDRHKWKPSIHLPKTLSRITLTITAVKVERLQDITGKDAFAEGVDRQECYGPECPDGPNGCNQRGCHGAREGFQRIWQSLNAKRAPWDSNPWVVAVTFEVHKCNIDRMAE